MLEDEDDDVVLLCCSPMMLNVGEKGKVLKRNEKNGVASFRS